MSSIEAQTLEVMYSLEIMIMYEVVHIVYAGDSDNILLFLLNAFLKLLNVYPRRQ